MPGKRLCEAKQTFSRRSQLVNFRFRYITCPFYFELLFKEFPLTTVFCAGFCFRLEGNPLALWLVIRLLL